MKVEHKLPPAVAAYAQRTLQQLQQVRTQYLSALGQAKECELAADAMRQALSQQLALVEETNGLPKPVAPYQLSADGTALVGEIADTATEAAATSDSAASATRAAALVNGASPVDRHA